MKIEMSLLRNAQGFAFLSYGFRPFFLAGAIYSGLAVAIWIPVYFGEVTLHTAFAPLDWHIHEMLFGFLPAVIAGFLLTAIPNWTGRPPVRGNLLLLMVVVWVLGRVAVACSGEVGWRAAMLVDVSFLLLAGAVAAREV
ncbi:MAG: NnrS family protein, partial [Afipia sp.]|nr:NnrS family protein [Afipia sp.]